MILNLLPPEYKSQLIKKRSWHEWRRATILLAVVTFFATVGLIVGHYQLQQRANSLQAQIDTLLHKSAASPSADITAVTTKFNATVSALNRETTTPRSWANNLAEIAAIIPEQTSVQSLSLTGSGKVVLEGRAQTRQVFIALDQAIKNSPLFEKVTTTSTPSTRINLPFNYSAQLRLEPKL